MADRIQVRRDTDADWASNNPTPAAGEPFFISDTNEFGVGDGSTAAASLDTVKLDGPRGVLGYAEATANQTGISTETDLTGLTVTVDVGSSRRIRVTGKGEVQQKTGAGVVRGRIKESTTELNNWLWHTLQADDRASGEASAVLTPSAGSHTYKLTLDTSGNTVDLVAASGRPAYILVEDIGPA